MLGLLSSGSEPLEELSLDRFFVELCLPIMPRTNASETGLALELCSKIPGASPGRIIELTDGAHELFCQAIARVNLPGSVLIHVLPLMHAVFSAAVTAQG